MSQLVLEISEKLHHKLESLARTEGVTLKQYVASALTRQAASGYIVKAESKKAVEQQEKDFSTLLQNLGQASFKEIEQVMQEREDAAPEAGLTPELVERLQARISNRRAMNLK